MEEEVVEEVEVAAAVAAAEEVLEVGLLLV